MDNSIIWLYCVCVVYETSHWQIHKVHLQVWNRRVCVKCLTIEIAFQKLNVLLEAYSLDVFHINIIGLKPLDRIIDRI